MPCVVSLAPGCVTPAAPTYPYAGTAARCRERWRPAYRGAGPLTACQQPRAAALLQREGHAVYIL
jgi:hypothetical protein